MCVMTNSRSFFSSWFWDAFRQVYQGGSHQPGKAKVKESRVQGQSHLDWRLYQWECVYWVWLWLGSSHFQEGGWWQLVLWRLTGPRLWEIQAKQNLEECFRRQDCLLWWLWVGRVNENEATWHHSLELHQLLIAICDDRGWNSVGSHHFRPQWEHQVLGSLQVVTTIHNNNIICNTTLLVSPTTNSCTKE